MRLPSACAVLLLVVSATAPAADKPAPKPTPLLADPERTFEIKPPPVYQRATVPLPAAADATRVGGGGRFIFYRLPTKKQLAVFDVSAGAVVKLLPLGEADSPFAAGMSKLFVLNKSAAAILRYDLETFEKDLTADYTLGGTPTQLRMGHSSAGPLYVGGKGVNGKAGYAFYDARTLKDVGVPLGGDSELKDKPPTGPGTADQSAAALEPVIEVSPDGRFYSWVLYGRELRSLALDDKRGTVKVDPPGRAEIVVALVPGPVAPEPGLGFHRRAFLIPQAALLAVLSPDGKTLHLHAVKVRDLLDTSGEEYLLVMSRPPLLAPRGKRWTYTPDVWSKKGGVKVEVVSGPPGLKEGVGTLTWDVPADMLDTAVAVELKVSDAGGKSLTQKFSLALDETAPHPPAPRVGSTAPADPTKGDGKGKGKAGDIVGTWAVDKMDIGSDFEVPLNELKKMRLTFESDGTTRVSGLPNAETHTGTYKLDPTASPNTINMTTKNPSGQETAYGLYELTGDTLKLCVSITLNSTRPTELKAKASETAVMTLKRVKE